MANGKQIYGSDGGGIVSITVPSGVTTDTTVTLQDKSGTIARLEDNGGRRNYLINGNFDMWQYATSQTSSGYGSDDRWTNRNDGSTKTHSRVACTDTERALFNASYFSRTIVSSVAGAGNRVNKYQLIEDITKLAGKTITLSFWAKADSSKNIAIEFVEEFGAGGSPSSALLGIGSQLIALTNAWQKKTITVTLPSIVGKTLGTDGAYTTTVGINFWFDAGSNHNSRTASLGQQSGTFDIAQVKIEDGSVATDGWHPYDGEFGGEVQACQRYYTTLAGYFHPDSNWVRGSVYNITDFRVNPNCTIKSISAGFGVFSFTTQSAKNEVRFYNDGNVSAGGGDLSITITASAEL